MKTSRRDFLKGALGAAGLAISSGLLVGDAKSETPFELAGKGGEIPRDFEIFDGRLELKDGISYPFIPLLHNVPGAYVIHRVHSKTRGTDRYTDRFDAWQWHGDSYQTAACKVLNESDVCSNPGCSEDKTRYPHYQYGYDPASGTWNLWSAVGYKLIKDDNGVRWFSDMECIVFDQGGSDYYFCRRGIPVAPEDAGTMRCNGEDNGGLSKAYTTMKNTRKMDFPVSGHKKLLNVSEADIHDFTGRIIYAFKDGIGTVKMRGLTGGYGPGPGGNDFWGELHSYGESSAKGEFPHP